MYKIRWIDAPLTHAALKKSGDLMLRSGYNADRTWGFHLTERRRERLSGTYVERIERIERVTDPFGQISEYTIVGFRNVGFVLRLGFPGIELHNPIRGVGRFLVRLAEHTEYAVPIGNVEVDVSTWAAALERMTAGCLVGAEYTEISLGKDTVGTLSVEGTANVRDPALTLLGRRRHHVTRAVVSWKGMAAEPIAAELREPGRATLIGDSSEPVLATIREALVAAHG
jgi:hypothetical protein